MKKLIILLFINSILSQQQILDIDYKKMSKILDRDSTVLIDVRTVDEFNSFRIKNSINIDFDGDGQKAFIFAVTLGDSLFDAIKIQSGAFKKDWDGDWIAKTKKYDTCLLYTSPSPRDPT